MHSLPRVAVVTVNYNGGPHLATCLASLAELDYPAGAWRLVIVDNASTDGSREALRARAPSEPPGFELIALPRNTGFTGGNNAGTRWALARGYDYVALVNNDVRVEPRWLSELVAVAEAGPDVAACGGKILTWDGATIEYGGTVFYKETTMGGYTDQPNDGRFSRVAPAGYACGGSCLLRAAALRALGLFDEDYFCYHEDVDWCVRAWVGGWRVLYVPGSVLYHRRGGSSEGTAFRDYIGPRNALTTWLKCYQPRTLRRFGSGVWRLYTGAAHLRRGLAYNALVLPRTLVKRRRVQRLRRVSDEEFFERLKG